MSEQDMTTEQKSAAQCAAEALFIEDDLTAIVASQLQEIERLNGVIAQQADQIERLTLDSAFLSGKAINHG